MKEYYNKFKEFKSDPKKKSFTLLIIYAIFFIFVFIYINSHTGVSTPVEKKDVELEDKSVDDVNSYEYSYEITIDEEIIKIEGTFYNNQQLFELNDNKYYIQDNKIYSSIDNSLIELDYQINKLNYNDLKEFINNYKYESKTEYKDDNIKYEYVIDNTEMADYFDEENYHEGNTFITVYEKDYIYQVEIDLSNYYNIDKYKFLINFDNVNNISDLEINNKAEL